MEIDVEKQVLRYDCATVNSLLDTVKENKGSFPFDSGLNALSQRGLPNSVITREINAIKDATSNNKGYFLSPEKLKAAYPTANEGSKAYVGENYPYRIYLFQDGLWTDSGRTGGDDAFNAGEFYTKTQIDQQHEAINNEIARVGKGANYEVLEYETSIATTRLKVEEGNRKGGYMITYNTGTGWIKEQYIGTLTDNEEWIKDENWDVVLEDSGIQAIVDDARKQAGNAAEKAQTAETAAQEAATQAVYAKEQADRAAEVIVSAFGSMPVNTILRTTAEAGNVFGEDWLPCDGSIVNRSDYPELKCKAAPTEDVMKSDLNEEVYRTSGSVRSLVMKKTGNTVLLFYTEGGLSIKSVLVQFGEDLKSSHSIDDREDILDVMTINGTIGFICERSGDISCFTDIKDIHLIVDGSASASSSTLLGGIFHNGKYYILTDGKGVGQSGALLVYEGTDGLDGWSVKSTIKDISAPNFFFYRCCSSSDETYKVGILCGDVTGNRMIAVGLYSSFGTGKRNSVSLAGRTVACAVNSVSGVLCLVDKRYVRTGTSDLKLPALEVWDGEEMNENNTRIFEDGGGFIVLCGNADTYKFVRMDDDGNMELLEASRPQADGSIDGITREGDHYIAVIGGKLFKTADFKQFEEVDVATGPFSGALVSTEYGVALTYNDNRGVAVDALTYNAYDSLKLPDIENHYIKAKRS